MSSDVATEKLVWAGLTTLGFTAPTTVMVGAGAPAAKLASRTQLTSWPLVRSMLQDQPLPDTSPGMTPVGRWPVTTTGLIVSAVPTLLTSIV